MADIHQLNHALSSPRNPSYPRFPKGAYWLLNECWVVILYRYLPDPYVVGFLQESMIAHQSLYLTADDCAVLGLPPQEIGQPHQCLEHLTQDDIDRAVTVLEGSRFQFALKKHRQFTHRTENDLIEGTLPPPGIPKPIVGIWLDDEFERLSRWIWELRLVESVDRDKHWPPSYIKNHGDLLAYSKRNPDVGWLGLNTSPDKLRDFALAVIAQHFRWKLEDRNNSIFISERVEDFLISWSEVSEQGSFRLGVTHRHYVGVSNGQDCRKMVYDFDPAAMQFHCFPVLSFPPVLETFLEGQLEL